MAFLEIKNLYKNFNEVEVLKGINFSLEKGEILSIIGSSGSGKTTLLRCVNFLESADQGVMTLDGEVLLNAEETNKEKDNTLREKRLNFGLVFQQFNLFPQYNVKNNITLAPMLLLKTKAKKLKEDLKKQGLKSKEIKIKVKEFLDDEKQKIEAEGEYLLEKIGLVEKKDSYPCELSGGQQQRVAIARALALKPKVLCFDEPTSALDPELTGEVLKVIKKLKKDGRTMIIVTHEMGFAKNVSDKVMFMADGVVEEMGSAKEVLSRPKSEKLKAFLKGVEEKENI